MIKHKITSGYVIQVFDTKKRKYIKQTFVAGEMNVFRLPPISIVSPDTIRINDQEFFLSFEMEQPDMRYIELFDLDGQPLGILKTTADDLNLDYLIVEYSKIEGDDKGADEFVKYCNKERPKYYFGLFFPEAEKVLAI